MVVHSSQLFTTLHLSQGSAIIYSYTVVNATNYRYLQLLDAIRDLDNAPVDTINPAEVVKGTARELELNTDMLILLARKYYGQKTLLRTIDIMLEGMYETARG